MAVATVTDPAAQSHLTAAGDHSGLLRVLGADGSAAPSGVVFPEQRPEPAAAVRLLSGLGVRADVERAGTADVRRAA